MYINIIGEIRLKCSVLYFTFLKLALNTTYTTLFIRNACLYIWHPIMTRWVPLMEQELLTLPELMSSPLVFSEVHVTQSLVFYVVLYRSSIVLLSFLPLYRLSFFDLRLGIILKLISSNFYYHMVPYRYIIVVQKHITIYNRGSICKYILSSNRNILAVRQTLVTICCIVSTTYWFVFLSTCTNLRTWTGTQTLHSLLP